MKRASVIILLWLLPFAALCPARTTQGNGAQKEKGKPDLSGQWALDEEVGGTHKPPRRPSDAVTHLVVLHRGEEVRFTRATTVNGAATERESIYYTDGRGETNLVPAITDKPGSVREEEVKSRTVWKGDKLVTRSVSRPLAVGRSVYVETVEEWKLSSDRTRLMRTLTVTVDSGRGVPYGPGVAGLPSPVRQPVIGGFVRELKSVYRRAQ